MACPEAARGAQPPESAMRGHALTAPVAAIARRAPPDSTPLIRATASPPSGGLFVSARLVCSRGRSVFNIPIGRDRCDNQEKTKHAGQGREQLARVHGKPSKIGDYSLLDLVDQP